MNSIRNLGGNFLYLSKNTENIFDLHKCCFQYIRNGNIVLFLTTSSKDLITGIDSKTFTKDELKRLVIIEVSDMDALIKKLLELHSWTWLPTLIVVDLRAIIMNFIVEEVHGLDNSEATRKPIAFFQQLALCIASLLGYYESISNRILRSANSRMNNTVGFGDNIKSVMILGEHPQNLSREQLELLINLYYYKNNAFEDIQELLEEIALKN